MIQPYQIFFPLGLIYAVLGLLSWPLFVGGFISYPGSLHANWMISGFLLSFITGFLMTATPRFTGTRHANIKELGIAFLCCLTPLVSSHQSKISYFIIFSFLSYFFFKRAIKAHFKIPDPFRFVGAGLIIALLSSILPLGKDLLYQGTILFFFMGIGGRLIPGLMGKAPEVRVIPISNIKVISISFIIFSTYLMENFLNWQIPGRLIRAVVISYLGFYYWRLGRGPAVRGQLPRWIWIGSTVFVISFWGYALLPQYSVHMGHFIFISGFTLLTLCVATRVTLAHGGYDLGLEARSKALLVYGLLTLLAATTRVSAGFLPQVYMSHLIYASLTQVLALIIWSAVFLPKIMKPLMREISVLRRTWVLRSKEKASGSSPQH